MPVFHLDIEAFLTTVERLEQPEFRKRPLVIAPSKDRALVLAASPDAKQLGIQRDMPLLFVRKNFPGIQIIEPCFSRYALANQHVLKLAASYSPIVEPLGYGHIALEMTGMHQLYRNLEDAAMSICRELNQQLGLPGTVGIAANKLVSSIAAKEVQKEKQPLYQVPLEQEAHFLSPLSCKVLPECQETSVRKILFELNLRRIQQIQTIPRDLLSFAIGALGTQLHRHAMGVDPSPVTPPRNLPSLRAEHRFSPDTNDDDIIRAAIYRLSESLSYTLRTRNLTARQARIHLRYTDDVVRERKVNFHATQAEEPIYTTLISHYPQLNDRRQRVRQLTLVYEGLSELAHQTLLFGPPREHQLASPLDKIRARFGTQAIQVGKGLKHTA